ICANVSFVDRFATPPVVFRGVHETVDGAWAQEDHPLVPGAAFPAPARLLASVPFEAWDMYYGERTRCCFAYFSVLSQQGLRVVVGAIYRSTQQFHALAAFRNPDSDPAALAALVRNLTALAPYSARAANDMESFVDDVPTLDAVTTEWKPKCAFFGNSDVDVDCAVYMGPFGGSVIKRLRLTDTMPELHLMDLYQNLARIYGIVGQAQHTDIHTRVAVDTDKNE
ncbi:MAG: hypothetical protein AAFS07_19280, partial [Pseudomonadota bacterium]